MAASSGEVSGGMEALTLREVSEWLRISRSTVYKLCQEGRIPATRIGRHW